MPYEIKDKATGEVLDVIQDNDPDLPSVALSRRAAGSSGWKRGGFSAW